MRNQEWNSSLAQLYPLDLRKLVFRLFRCDSVDSEATFGVINESEVFACFLDRDNVLESRWVCCIGTNFAVDFDEALHHNSFSLARIECVLEALRQTLAQLRSNCSIKKTYRFRMKTIRGIQSLVLCGPAEGFGAYAPPSLSRSQWWGADKRFWLTSEVQLDQILSSEDFYVLLLWTTTHACWIEGSSVVVKSGMSCCGIVSLS